MRVEVTNERKGFFKKKKKKEAKGETGRLKS